MRFSNDHRNENSPTDIALFAKDHEAIMVDLTRQRIKQHRKARGWSQAELSRRTGIHTSTLSHLESRHMKLWPGHIKRIALALGLTLDELRGAV